MILVLLFNGHEPYLNDISQQDILRTERERERERAKEAGLSINVKKINGKNRKTRKEEEVKY